MFVEIFVGLLLIGGAIALLRVRSTMAQPKLVSTEVTGDANSSLGTTSRTILGRLDETTNILCGPDELEDLANAIATTGTRPKIRAIRILDPDCGSRNPAVEPELVAKFYFHRTGEVCRTVVLTYPDSNGKVRAFEAHSDISPMKVIALGTMLSTDETQLSKSRSHRNFGPIADTPQYAES